MIVLIELYQVEVGHKDQRTGQELQKAVVVSVFVCGVLKLQERKGKSEGKSGMCRLEGDSEVMEVDN